MARLTAPRNTPARSGERFNRPLLTGAIIHQGSIVCLDPAGYARPGDTGLGLKGDGRALQSADASGQPSGAVSVEVDRGVFRFASAGGGDAITRARIGSTVFMVDDQTVAATDGGGTRSPAGRLEDVDAEGVWVRFS